MLKKTVKYTDYEGRPQNTVLYFNLNKFEWLELETFTRGGLIENLNHALETSNMKKTIDILKKIILRAYGEKDEETGEFVKDDARAIRFSRTEAFSELFYDLAYNEESASEFFMALVPHDIRDEVAKKVTEKDDSLPNIIVRETETTV